MAAAGLMAATTALVSGCSSTPSDAPEADTTTQAPEPASEESPATLAKVFEGSGQEWEQALRNCLENAGWPAVDNGDGTWTWPGTENDPTGFDQAYADCEAEVGAAPPPPPRSDTEYAAMYDFMLETRDCLTGLGYSISEPPSVEQWTDDYRASYEGGELPWLPWFEMPVAGAPNVEEQCPQEPREGWPAYFAARGVDG